MTRINPVETNRLFLRELNEGDFEDIYEFKSDLKVVEYLTWGPSSREQHYIALESRLLSKRRKQTNICFSGSTKRN